MSVTNDKGGAYGFTLSLSRCRVAIPARVSALQLQAPSPGPPHLAARFTLSLFDASSRTFVGRSHHTQQRRQLNTVDGSDGLLADVVACDEELSLVVSASIRVQQLFVIVETSLLQLDPTGGEPTREIALGWAPLPLSSLQAHVAAPTEAPLFAGSPRLLLLNSDRSEPGAGLSTIASCRLSYLLSDNPALAAVCTPSHGDCMWGAGKEIPLFVRPPESMRSMVNADAFPLDAAPRLALVLRRVVLSLQPGFEARLESIFEGSMTRHCPMRILSRHLMVTETNGLAVCSQMTVPLRLASDEKLFPERDLRVRNFSPTAGCSLCFSLFYAIGATHHSSTAQNVLVACAELAPCAQVDGASHARTLCFSTNSERSLELQLSTQYPQSMRLLDGGCAGIGTQENITLSCDIDVVMDSPALPTQQEIPSAASRFSPAFTDAIELSASTSPPPPQHEPSPSQRRQGDARVQDGDTHSSNPTDDSSFSSQSSSRDSSQSSSVESHDAEMELRRLRPSVSNAARPPSVESELGTSNALLSRLISLPVRGNIAERTKSRSSVSFIAPLLPSTVLQPQQQHSAHDAYVLLLLQQQRGSENRAAAEGIIYSTRTPFSPGSRGDESPLHGHSLFSQDRTRLAALGLPVLQSDAFRISIPDAGLELSDALAAHTLTLTFASYIGSLQEESLILGLQFYNAPYTRLGLARLVKTPHISSSLQPTPQPPPQPTPQLLVLESETSSGGLLPAAFPTFALRIDTSVLSPTERAAFAAYLCSADLQVDLWDGTSLLPVGTCVLPLSLLSRQQSPAVCVAREFDVISSPSACDEDRDPGAGTMGEAFSAFPVMGAPCVRRDGRVRGCAGKVVGRLQVVMSNVGSQGSVMLPVASFGETAGGGSLSAPPSRRSSHTHSQAQPFSTISSPAAAAASQHTYFKARVAPAHMSTSLSLQFHAVRGQASFLEVTLTNPFEHVETFEAHLSSGAGAEADDLRLLTDSAEWLHYRACVAPALRDPGQSYLELRARSSEWSPAVGSGCPTVTLAPGECVTLPLVFLTMRMTSESSNGCSPRGISILQPNPPPNTSAEMDTVDCEALLVSTTHGSAVAAIRMTIALAPPVIHRFARYAAPEHSWVRGALALPPELPTGDRLGDGCGIATFPSGGHAVCIPPHEPVVVAVESSNGGARELRFRVKTEAASSTTFHVLLFDDAYCATLRSVWRVIVHALLAAEAPACTPGQAMVMSLPLQSSQSARSQRVSLYTDAPGELSFPTGMHGGGSSAPAMTLLPRDSHQSIDVNICSLLPGPRRAVFTVHAINATSRALVAAWRISAWVAPPAITRVYDLTVALGGEPSSSTPKRITFANEWPSERTVRIASSRSDLVSIRGSPCITLPPRGSGTFRLLVGAPTPPRVTAEVCLYVSDEGGLVEETLLVRVRWE